MPGLRLLLLVILVQIATSIRYQEEVCTSRYGWRGTCKASWDCLVLGDLVAQGYQPELCGSSRGPIACCPTTTTSQPQFTYPNYPWYPQTFHHQNYVQTHGLQPFGISPPNPFFTGPRLLSIPPTYKKKRKAPTAYLKTYIQDEDDNTLVKVTPIRTPLNRKKRKPLSTSFKALQKNKGPSYPMDLVVQDDQLSFSYEKPQNPSAKMCQEYGVLAWENLSEISSDDGVSISDEYCPGKKRDSSVQESEFPFMVGLGYEDINGKTLWGCSGTLISREYVLTAAHCLHPPLSRPKVARLGTARLGAGGNGFEVGISEMILHPLYNPADRSANLALLRLAPAPHLGIKVRPACLQSNSTGLLLTPYWVKDPTVTLDVQMKGNDFQLHTDAEDIVLRKSVSIELKSNQCNVTSEDENIICVEPITTSSCQSLSEGGEPLLQADIYNHCLYTVTGITVDKACTPFQPTIYTRLEPYISWIENIVWP